MSSAGALGATLLALASGCRHQETACFKLQSIGDPDAGPGTHHLFEAFVLAHPPDRFDELRAALTRTCGDLPAPAPEAEVQWWVFRESPETPRTMPVGFGKQDSLDRHTGDLILDVHVRRSACGDSATYFFYPRGYEKTPPGEMPAGLVFALPRAPDATPVPQRCRK